MSFPPPLELQAALTGAFGQGLYTAVVDIAAAVKNDFLDLLGLRTLGEEQADLLGSFAVAGRTLKLLLHGRSGNQSGSIDIINDLRIDV